MIEIPEAQALAVQLNAAVQGKRIAAVTAATSPQKWAWYFGDPREYPARLCGKTVGASCAWGGFVEIVVDDVTLLIAEGAGLRLYRSGEQRPTSINCCSNSPVVTR